jgi:uncharacterized membrane protein
MFALALLGWAILHFVFGDFLFGRAPAWPEATPGRLVWAYGSAAVLFVTGTTVLLQKGGRGGLILLGVMVFVWALTRQVISLIAEPELGGRLTMAGKALTFFGGAFAVAATLPFVQGKPSAFLDFLNQTDHFKMLGRFCLGIFMILCGVQHFLFWQFVQTLVPSWIPGALFWTYFAGVALMAGGIGLMIPSTAPLAGRLSGIMVFIWFAILHIPRGLEMNSANEWTAVVESFAVSGLAFVLSRR